MIATSVRRLDFGYFVRPPEETGTGASRVEPCLGYLVEHPGGLILMDTGMGAHPDVDAHYKPRRHSLQAALAGVGVSIAEVSLVMNCHLHFDHCGGNPELKGHEVVVQRVELEAARNTADYTLPELVDVPGIRYAEIEGDAELMDGVHVIATPGHTAGHQSLAVRVADGTVFVAGQSHDSASAFAADALAWQAAKDGHAAELPDIPDWLERIRGLDPRRVVFAHDFAVWMP